jgi:CPA1 family monovalent cation:H+ antiporter
MDLILSHTVALLVVAIFVAIIARLIRLPYTVGLVITGIGLALARVETESTLTHDFIFDVILPPLLFEAALSLHWAELRRDALPVLTLSTLGVVGSALVVGAGMFGILGWPVSPIASRSAALPGPIAMDDPSRMRIRRSKRPFKAASDRWRYGCPCI